MKTTKAKPEKDEEQAPTQVLEMAPPPPAPPAAPELPPISDMMKKLLKGFQNAPGHWFYHIDRFAPDIEAQLVRRGLVIRGEFESKGRMLIRYCGKPIDGSPPAVEFPPL